LLSLFEPIIILVMGIAIGSIVLSILWAIFSVNQMNF
jgi:type II secretory pathway component PulF